MVIIIIYFSFINFNFSDKNEEVQGIQQKINFYKEGIQKLKAQMEGFYNLKK